MKPGEYTAQMQSPAIITVNEEGMISIKTEFVITTPGEEFSKRITVESEPRPTRTVREGGEGG